MRPAAGPGPVTAAAAQRRSRTAYGRVTAVAENGAAGARPRRYPPHVPAAPIRSAARHGHSTDDQPDAAPSPRVDAAHAAVDPQHAYRANRRAARPAAAVRPGVRARPGRGLRVGRTASRRTRAADRGGCPHVAGTRRWDRPGTRPRRRPRRLAASRERRYDWRTMPRHADDIFRASLEAPAPGGALVRASDRTPRPASPSPVAPEHRRCSRRARTPSPHRRQSLTP